MNLLYGRQTRRGILRIAGAGMMAVAVRPANAANFGQLAPIGSSSISHSEFDQLLQRYVKPDNNHYHRVDYTALKRDGALPLKSYIARLCSIDPATLSLKDGHAFWINLYNAKTLEVVIDHWPVRSIKDVRLGGGGIFKTGPWSKKIMTVGGIELSLDDVEHEIVRAFFKNPMSHYGLNCASYSCPNLAARAYTGENVDILLAQNAYDYVNHPRGVEVSDGAITASKIYSWYVEDFGGESSLKAHWKSFASADLAQRIDSAIIGSFVYDWTLNNVR